MENMQAEAAPLAAAPAVSTAPEAPKAKLHQSNALVEVMEGVTLSALLILFAFLYMFGALYILNPSA